MKTVTVTFVYVIYVKNKLSFKILLANTTVDYAHVHTSVGALMSKSAIYDITSAINI